MGPSSAQQQAARALGQTVLLPGDDAWPTARFLGVNPPPDALFLRGHLPAPEAACVAIVGTRNASPYGLRVAAELAAGLVRAGAWVVSGFALGIDGAAHEAVIRTGGHTLAVLGCGVDHDYPVAHGDLREEVARTGGLVSEYPPGTEPRRHHFPRRNRLVAAFAQAVVVVEASERSGSLITARLALELGRDVLAVPGSIHRRQQRGCHRLLREGASPCCGVEDIQRVLGLREDVRPTRPPPSDAAEAAVWRALDDEEVRDADGLCLTTGLPAVEVAVALTGLELQGYARRLPGVGFIRA